LRDFMAAAQNRRFSMAAAAGHVSQSAISQAALAREETLGTRLLPAG